MPAPAGPDDITGLVLCGGRGTRMGGLDKGLQPHHGTPLALHALRRLQPQVGMVAINANRNLPAYAALGAPVWADTVPGQPGPLAGWLAGLQRCTTPYLATVPCDSPGFPTDLVARLATALAAQGASIAMAATLHAGVPRAQPVFSLLHTGLRDDLAAALAAGERGVQRWSARHPRALVVFDDDGAFFNANTPEDLRQLGGA